MRKFLYTILATFLIANVQAQSIKGKIKATNGNALEAATISILNTEKTTITDEQGNFMFKNIATGIYQLSISSIGFATQLKEVTVTSNQTTEINISLTEQGKQLDEVVVNAQKTEQSILKAPVAVSVLNADKVQQTRTNGFNGLNGIIPNYLNQDVGVGFQQVQSIRGIQVFSENPAVATYIDDVNNLDILANGMMLTDIEKIEVLRGPQATLFGRNAMGGVVNIVTKKPINKTEGFAEFEMGNLAAKRYSFGFKTPLVKDKLFFGVNALYNYRNGYWKNDTTGTGATDASLVGRRVGDESNLYGNVYVKWLPSSKFSATLNVKSQLDWSNSTAFFVSQNNLAKAFSNPSTINLSRIGQHERKITNSSLSLKYFAPSFTLTAITVNSG
jgi:iron complex outermembrane recepter protein